jgi:hypothetical protein
MVHRLAGACAGIAGGCSPEAGHASGCPWGVVTEHWPAILAELRAGEGTPGQQIQAAYWGGHRDGSAERDRALDLLDERWRHIIAQVLQLTEDGVISGGRAAEVLGVDRVIWRTLADAVEGEDPAELLAAAELRPESLESKLAALCREREVDLNDLKRELNGAERRLREYAADRDRLAGELAEARLDAKQHWTHARQADAGLAAAREREGRWRAALERLEASNRAASVHCDCGTYYAERFTYSQQFSQVDPWEERVNGKDAHEFAAMAEFGLPVAAEC